MNKIHNLTQKEWIDKRKKLEEMISANTQFKYFAIKRFLNAREPNRTFISFEGVTLPCAFYESKMQLFAHSRGARHSGRDISVSELCDLENCFITWYKENFIYD